MPIEMLMSLISAGKGKKIENPDEYFSNLGLNDAATFLLLLRGYWILDNTSYENFGEILDETLEEFKENHKENDSDILIQWISEGIGEYAFDIGFDEDKIRNALALGYYPMSCNMDGIDFLAVKHHSSKCIITFDNLHISRNVPVFIKKKFGDYTIAFNKDFKRTVEVLNQTYPDTWLCPELVETLEKIHDNPDSMVSVDSVEIYKDGKLVAGEIGFITGNAYASLSGFHLENDIGHVQMALLGMFLKSSGFAYWDLGMSIPYKYRYGAEDFSREEQKEIYSALSKERLGLPSGEMTLKEFYKKFSC